jgi:CRISPR/Cas system-associated exonuclease Cas4 (RecB family)
LRLFNRGHREEPIVHSELQAIGYEVLAFDEDGKQFSIGGESDWFRGHCDGIVKKDNKESLLEIKTASNYSHKGLQKSGVKCHQPKHYAQVQVYMSLLGLDDCIYIAVNKDNDDLYIEIIERNDNDANFYIERAKTITTSTSLPPAKMEEKKCRGCPASEYCRSGQVDLWRSTPTCKNCFLFCTCQKLKDRQEGASKKGREMATIDFLACDSHVFVPEAFAALSAEDCIISEDGSEIEYYDVEHNLLFRNSNSPKSLSSNEIARLDASMLRGVAQAEKENGMKFVGEFDKKIYAKYPLAVRSFAGGVDEGREFFKKMNGKKKAPEVATIDGKKYIDYGFCVVVADEDQIEIYETNN